MSRLFQFARPMADQHFTLKKIRLLIFLTRRVPRFGWPQLLRGIRERKVSYLAMDLADMLPGSVATIVDVGAHSGLVADALDFLFRPERLWAVEPNPAHSQNLDARLGNRPHINIVKCCLGETSGEVNFNVYDFDAASSLYSCLPGHLESLGLSEGHSPLKVKMTTLRELLPENLKTLDLLKLDCQGAELAVLKGAGPRIHQIRWVYCEVSIDPIYSGSPLFGELHAFLRSKGFELHRLGGFSGARHSIHWADALYANAEVVVS